MKYLLFSVLTLTLTTLSIAQNSDKTNCGHVYYIQPPADMSLQTFKTYYVDATVPENNATYKDVIYKELYLPGFKRTETRESADFIINFTMYPLVFGKLEEKSFTSEVEKDGVKSTKTTYQTSCNFVHKSIINVLKKDGMSIYSQEISGELTHTGQASDTKSTALSNYNSTKATAATEPLRSSVSNMNSEIKDKYCYLPQEFGLDLITVKPKKFNYDNFNKGAELIKQAIALRTEETIIPEEAKVLCKQAVDIWLVELKESDLVDKKARINDQLTGALYYNIGMTYFLLGDYQLANDNLLKAAEFDKNVTMSHVSFIRDSKIMIDRAANQK